MVWRAAKVASRQLAAPVPLTAGPLSIAARSQSPTNRLAHRRFHRLPALLGAALLAAPQLAHAQGPLYTLLDLGSLGSTPTVGTAINLSGSIVGYGADLNGVTQAFVYSNGSLSQLPDLGGGGGAAYGINDAGAIVGASYTADLNQHAFLYANGNLTDLGTLGGNSSFAAAINNNGLIAGDSYTAAGADHAFVYSFSRKR